MESTRNEERDTRVVHITASKDRQKEGREGGRNKRRRHEEKETKRESIVKRNKCEKFENKLNGGGKERIGVCVVCE